MLDIVIIDDEKQVRIALSEELKTLNAALHIAGEAGFIQEAVQLIDSVKPDLVLLDIQLGDGSGFKVLEQATYKNFQTIFITAYSEHAIQAFKANAIDYILKPVDAVELNNAIQKVIRNKELLATAKQNSKIDVSLIRKRVSFQTTEGISLHFIDEIVYCQASGNYSIIYFIDKTKLMVTKTLKELDEILAVHQFERVHQSYLINMLHCKKFINKDGGYLLLLDDIQIPVSQRKKNQLMHLLLQK